MFCLSFPPLPTFSTDALRIFFVLIVVCVHTDNQIYMTNESHNRILFEKKKLFKANNITGHPKFLIEHHFTTLCRNDSCDNCWPLCCGLQGHISYAHVMETFFEWERMSRNIPFSVQYTSRGLDKNMVKIAT